MTKQAWDNEKLLTNAVILCTEFTLGDKSCLKKILHAKRAD